MPNFFDLQYLDFESFLAAYGSNPFNVFLFLFLNGGFLIVFILMVVYGVTGFMRYNRERTKRRRKYVVLQLNVPRENEQSMKAVEKLFVQLQGAVDRPNLKEKYWDGWLQESFSFEIASIDGRTRFFAHTPEYYRDLVESAIYAQYPDAEITAVDDYAKTVNFKQVEKGEYKVWGAEMQLTKEDFVPVRNYERFEHGLEGRFIDPMAGLLEIMSRLEPGEQIWYQVIITPLSEKEDESFRDSGNKAILKVTSRTKLYGQEYGAQKTALDHVIDAPMKTLEVAGEQVFGPTEKSTERDEGMDKSLYLVEPERELVSAIDAKVSQVVHRAKIRFLYIARPQVYQEFKGRRGILGAIYQYNGPNNFKPGRITQTDVKGYPFRGAEYFFRDYRLKRRAVKLLWAYQSRDWERGENFGHVFAVDELASLYHFPIMDVRAPFVTKAEAKRVEPPHQLSMGEDEGVTAAPDAAQAREEIEEEARHDLPEEVITGLPVSAPSPNQPSPTSPTSPAPQEKTSQNEGSPERGDSGAPPANLPVV